MNGNKIMKTDIVEFTNPHLAGYGWDRNGHPADKGRVIFSRKINGCHWTKLTKLTKLSNLPGLTINGCYWSCMDIKRVINLQLQAESTDKNSANKFAAREGATSVDTQFIVFSTKHGVSQMFDANTTLVDVHKIFSKRSVALDDSFSIFVPKTGEIRELKIVLTPSFIIG